MKNNIRDLSVRRVNISEAPVASWNKVKGSKPVPGGSFFISRSSDESVEGVQYVGYAMTPELLEKMFKELREFFPRPFGTRIENVMVDDPTGSSFKIKSRRLVVFTPKHNEWVEFIAKIHAKKFFIGKMGYSLHIEETANPVVMKEFIESNPEFFPHFSEVLLQDGLVVVTDEKNKLPWISLVKSRLLTLRNQNFGSIHITTPQMLKAEAIAEKEKMKAEIIAQQKKDAESRINDVKELLAGIKILGVSRAMGDENAFDTAKEMGRDLLFLKETRNYRVVSKIKLNQILAKLLESKLFSGRKVQSFKLNGVTVHQL